MKNRPLIISTANYRVVETDVVVATDELSIESSQLEAEPQKRVFQETQVQELPEQVPPSPVRKIPRLFE